MGTSNGGPTRLFKYLTYRQGFFDCLSLRVTPPNQFNDPFETMLSGDSYDALLQGEMRALIHRKGNRTEDKKIKLNMEELGLICFTGNENSPEMWSIFADGHAGILIEFGNFSHSFYRAEVSLIGDVPNLIKTKLTSVIYRSCIKRPDVEPRNYEDLSLAIFQFWFTKSSTWALEKEYRMAFNFVKAPYIIKENINEEIMWFVRIPENIILKIYIGCKATNKNKIIEEIRGNKKLSHVQIFESIEHKNNYQIYYEKIN